MKKLKYTPGPWSNTGLEIRHAERSLILAIVYNHLPINQSKEESTANAKLIAAAPELLSALQYLVNDIERNDGDLHNRATLINEAKEVIKKATE